MWRSRTFSRAYFCGEGVSDTRVSDTRPIIDEIIKNKFGCFSGIGRYTANDLLHVMCIYPLTPAAEICKDDRSFFSFREALYDYINSFNSPSYLDRASSVPNTTNPFSFNEWANSEYLSRWVYVYRRTKAVVPVSLYNRYVSLGLLDDTHIIGKRSSFQFVVYHHKG